MMAILYDGHPYLNDCNFHPITHPVPAGRLPPRMCGNSASKSVEMVQKADVMSGITPLLSSG